MTVESREASEASAGNAGSAVEIHESRAESESAQGSSLIPDAVDRYGLESFPASDPPSWWAGDSSVISGRRPLSRMATVETPPEQHGCRSSQP